jgi:O-antigen ligase
MTSHERSHWTKITGRPAVRLGLALAAVSVVAALALNWLEDLLVSFDGIWAVVVGATLLLVACLLSTSAKQQGYCQASFKPALAIWIFLLVSEDVFSRGGGDAESAFQERFSVAAYGEVSMWILALLILLILSVKGPPYLRYMFSGQYKFVWIFGLMCLLSAVYSPRPLFSAAWAFKLCLVILLLAICSGLIQDERDLAAFVRATFWACFILVAVAVWKAFADPSTGFEGGRLGESPTSLSVIAGVLLVLSFTLRFSVAPGSRLIYHIAAVIASVVMILSGGKAGIVGGLLSAILFFLIKRKLGSALSMLSGIVGLGVLLLLVSTPLQSYFDTYGASAQVDSLTGRTDLWVAALPAIGQSPVLGHGYMASKFVSIQLEGVRWEASHLHNAFLEVLYNNGIIGFLSLLLINLFIINNLLSIIRHPAPRRELWEIAAGLFAVYANLLVNAFFNAIIGGRPGSLFMIFLAVFALSDRLQKGLTQNSACRAQPGEFGRSVWSHDYSDSAAQT